MCISVSQIRFSLAADFVLGANTSTEWPKISENVVICDSVIVDLTPLNFAYLYCR